LKERLMSQLTLGKLRGLQLLANADGIFTMTALDHRGTLEQMLRKSMGQPPDWESVVREKQRMAEVFAPHSSALLIDPVYGAGPLIARGSIPRTCSFLVALEQSGYEGTDANRVTVLQPDWDVKAIKRLGAAAVKLLLLYHPDSAAARQQEDLVKQVAEECRAQDIAFLLEPVVYPVVAGQKRQDPEFAARRPELVLQTVERLAPLGVDVLKSEFPTEASFEKDTGRMATFCREIDRVAGIPWVLLSAGVDFLTFQQQVEIACDAGASGFLAGRAIWQEGMAMRDIQEREHFLRTVAVSRLRILNAIAEHRATPWHKKVTPERLPVVEQDWYRGYHHGAIEQRINL
jgi:Tagatose-1,6-bisphosphate aldolase